MIARNASPVGLWMWMSLDFGMAPENDHVSRLEGTWKHGFQAWLHSRITWEIKKKKKKCRFLGTVSDLPKKNLLRQSSQTYILQPSQAILKQSVHGLAFGNHCLRKHLIQLPWFPQEKTETQKGCELCSDPGVDLKSLFFFLQRLCSLERAVYRVRI